MSTCPTDADLLNFSRGLLDGDARIDVIGDHLETCQCCAKKLNALPPSKYEVDFRKTFLGDDLTEGVKGLIDDQLEGAEEFSEAIARSVPSPRGVGENKKGRFENRQPIGRGHFFSCFKACDCWDRKAVAIKIPREGSLASDEHFFQLQRDCDAYCQLDHPNIAPLRDFGFWDDRRWFICTEWLDAKPLNEWVEAVEFDLTACFKLVAQICHAVQHAHEKQVVHRHLDYRNVLVNDVGHVWVTDFGFVFDQRYQFDLLETRKQRSTFLPAEFFETDRKVNERSDVFSIGKILQYCLQNTCQPDESIVEALAPVITQCEAKSRTLRFGTVQALMQAIGNCHPTLEGFGR